MNIVIITRAFAVALVLVLTATGLWASGADEEEPAAATDKETVFDPATGQTWTAPEYGGTLTQGVRGFPPNNNSDGWSVHPGWAAHLISGVNEKLAFVDWGQSRDIWTGTQPWTAEMFIGNLAESWSTPDDTTFIWHIRQGVYWDNKAPVNGREFDAHDVEYNYHRYLGLGDFTEDGPSAHQSAITASGRAGVEIESVTATDKWTVVVKLKPHVLVLQHMLNNYLMIYAPEQIDEYGDAKDWRNLVGTGPLRLTDVVEGSSATWEKNPNYWGYDEKFPENRLPYIDKLRSLLLPDVSARLAAMRTGKIDMLSNTGDAYIQSLDDVESLQKTNPEIDVWPTYAWIAGAFLFNQSLPLTADVNVRKALQMSVDRETISATYYKGWGDPTPGALFNQRFIGYSWPMENWPDEVKREYEYHPEEAEALLDAAGYLRGADGYRFKVKLANNEANDSTYPEIIMGYFEAIGVDSELVILTRAEVGASQRADTHEWHLADGGWMGLTTHFGIGSVSQNIDGFSFNKAKDPRMEALYYAAEETMDIEEYKSIQRQADEITVREHWGLSKPFSPIVFVSHPWVQGYFGEDSLGRGERNTFLARLWIDSELKEAMMGN